MTNTFPSPFTTGIQQLPAFIPVAVVPIVISIQRRSVVVSGGDVSGSITLSPSIDTSKTLLSLRGVDVRGVLGSENITNYTFTVEFSGGGSSVLCTRSNVNDDNEVFVTVMEFGSGISTQPVSVDLSSSDATGIATITAVDTTKTIIITNGTQGVGGGLGDGQDWMTWWDLTNSTTVTLTRDAGHAGVQAKSRATVLEFL